MKKKILIGLLVIVALFTFTGCGKKDKCTGDDCNKKDKKALSEPTASIGDVKYTFDADSEINVLKYKYPSTANASSLGTYSIIDSIDENNKLVFRISLYCFTNQTSYEVMQNSTLEYTGDVDVSGDKWNIYEGELDGKIVKTFVFTKDYDTYTISFQSDYDIEEFIDTFLGTLNF